MTSDDIPAAPGSTEYIPDEIVLYGVKLNEDRDLASLPFGTKRIRLEVRDESGQVMSREILTIAAIYSYSFEGGCYRFDRPKLMIFEAPEEKEVKGCGYEEGSGYKMWRIDAKFGLMELNTSVDLAETLVLEANLPGNRAPNTYGNSMQLAHRGNRLSKYGGGTP
ncbi:hypothetical protein ACG873_08020 [Mesorhizobium sp. AaZ16]|uniref:hypothetical protein n=1 Tax=Mesorhizobium sp. AaZ16 TaxID=3402289 RepID=UPI00374E95B8